MRKTMALVGRELVAYFSSPLAYVVLTLFLFTHGYIFKEIVRALNMPTAAPGAVLEILFTNVFFWIINLVFLPAITMRLIAEERSAGTLEVLLTSPVSEAQVVVSKFIAGMVFYLFLWLPTIIFVAILRSHSTLDPGPIAAGYLGVFLVGLLFIAIGLFASSLVRSQIVAALLAFAMLLVLFLVGLFSTYYGAESFKPIATYVSVFEHMRDFAKGIVDTRHIVFPVTLTGLFLFLATKAVEARKGR